MENEHTGGHVRRKNEEFYSQIICRIVRYQRPYLPLEDAEDCAQGLMLKLWANHREELEDYRRGLRPETWLRVSAENAAKNLVIERRRHHGDDETCALDLIQAEERACVAACSREISLEGLAIAHELENRLNGALSRLPGANTRVLLRHFVEGETWVEIAASAGDSPDNVRQKAVRTLRRLKRILDEDGLDLVEADEYLAGIMRR